MAQAHSELILPTGTQVVTRADLRDAAGAVVRQRGAVGRIVAAPSDASHTYRVRFADGGEAALRRSELSIRKDYQRDGLRPEAALDEHDLAPYIIYRCVVGSRAYGLDDDASDTDRRGIYLPPADLHWSLYGLPEQIEDDVTRDTYWELQKFLVMALKANPNVLECLYTPLVEHAAPLAEELRAMREAFLSKLIYQTYNGYVLSQFKKLEQDLRTKGAIKQKHAMHLIRLLLSGTTALREGVIPVRVAEQRDQLLAIKRGELSWEAVNAWRLELHHAFDAAFASTRLPDRPDYQRANAFLLRARRSMTG
jgi:predicted nucleotidyltransferase